MFTVTYSTLCIRSDLKKKKKKKNQSPKTSSHHPTLQFFQVLQAKIQVSLHIWAVWTGSTLSAWKSCYYLAPQRASSED